MRPLNPRRPHFLARRKFSQINPTRSVLPALAALCLVAGFYFAPSLDETNGNIESRRRAFA